jgi:pimeloyl-ACP methyl ester carboxylesterase
VTTYVLAAGAWLGGWSWQTVAGRLRGQGHDVYPVTLTGLGERRHLARPEVDLDTHITDIINLIEYEELRDVVLVGHSYAGIVITGVADRVPERIGRLVYLDSGPVPDGTPFIDMSEGEAREFTERLVAEQGDGWRLPMPSWEDQERNGASLAGLDQQQRELVRARAVAQPFRTYTQPLRLHNPPSETLPKVLISCSFPVAQVRELIASGHPWFRDLGGPEWQLLELPTGHWPMFSVPDELAAVLHSLSIPASVPSA